MSDLVVQVIAHSPDPERLVAAAARSCWSNRPLPDIFDSLRDRDIGRLLAKVIRRGHHSVLEHADFTFAISGVSRVLTHQLVRHRIASYSQLSQQRVDHSEIGFIIPPELRGDSMVSEKYLAWMNAAREFYSFLVDRGVPKGSARYVLPSACESRIVLTMNARSLFNLLSQRECGKEEWEFRDLAHAMHQELLGIAPRIFRLAGPRCGAQGNCPEGKVAAKCPSSPNFVVAIRVPEPEMQVV